MTSPLIRIAALTFAYPDGQPALSDVAFTIAPYERVALVGPNGAGKSTLLLHLNGVLRAPAAHIEVDGLLLSDKTIGQIRARVGLLFQDPDDQLFSPTVYQDVAFGPRHMGLPAAEIHARVEAALAAVGLSDFARRAPYHLSMGEKKRAALATILSMNPQILVLDEPSAGLDPRARRALISLLRGLPPRALLISTHDMRLAAALCTRVILLDGGRIVADGDAASIFADSDLLERHGLEAPDPMP